MEETPLKTLTNNIKSWPLSRKLSLTGIAMLSLILFSLIIFQFNRTEYAPLYTRLSQEEAASVTQWLKEQNIPYQLKNNGQSIYVPANNVYGTRLDLAGAGLPRQGGVGFEIFDKQGFGTTNFTQKINYQRALQGELSRTIGALEAVKTARVHLVLPEKRLLAEQQQQAKASVVLDLAMGHTLAPDQIQGIIHLVAGSIEGLEKTMVTVLDTRGQTLSSGSRKDPDNWMLPEKLKFKNTLESDLENRAQSLLDRALGHGNSIVRVTAELDFTQEAITKEEYDPDSLVPRSERITGSESGSRQVGGVPGVEANLGEDDPFETVIPTIQTSETTNYEISKTIKQIIHPTGRIKHLSAAVLLAEKTVPAQEGEGVMPVPFSEEQINSISRMVSSALGIDMGRGDRIEVVAMPFMPSSLQISAMDTEPETPGYLSYIKYIILFICALLLYRILVRPMVKTLRDEAIPYNRTVKELESEYGQELKALDPPARLRKELAENSVSPTQVIRAWLKEG